MTNFNKNQCRKGCAACCIVISISSALPGMPDGKPAGVRCVNLDENNCCIIHDKPNFPRVCRNFKFDPVCCGSTNEEAMKNLDKLEKLTSQV